MTVESENAVHYHVTHKGLRLLALAEGALRAGADQEQMVEIIATDVGIDKEDVLPMLAHVLAVQATDKGQGVTDRQVYEYLVLLGLENDLSPTTE